MKRFSEHNEHLDTELNIVPVIDCFVMLICFLLFTAAFTQLVFLEAKLTSNTAAAANKSRSELDQFRLVITVKDDGFQLATSGSEAKQRMNTFIASTNQGYDFKRLHQEIISLKSANPERFSADIDVKARHTENIPYERILQIIDSVRHLSDEEYGTLRVAQKKIRNVSLGDSEKEKVVPEHIQVLAQNLLANDVAKNTDQKALFPDIALLGVQ